MGIRFYFKSPIDSKQKLENKTDDEEQKGGVGDECNATVSRKNY
ncbi:hypothetical protein [Spiroplasma endosymbiont of Poecilobothrus nobilitatus]